ncbi:unnamed protein product [Nippostrongylus brasiliensis]|uniref:DUF148 domain-containing protein n=1 Tax=Nippostrongylus brasiliensis TaxID=27835 RepID=A0A0N4YV76_NIPBR|nr:unnamed protein product [Nippostrongylus brasiliensis]
MNKALLTAVLALTATAHFHGKDHEHGPHGHHHHHHGPPPPPYLKNVTDDARKEFFSIVKSKNITIAEIRKAVLEWGEKYGIKDQVEQFEEDRKKFIEEFKKNVTELIEQLPTAFEKFSAIKEDLSLTHPEQEDKLEELQAGRPEVYHVLKAAFHQFGPPGHGHHHGGKFKGGRKPHHPPSSSEEADEKDEE